MDLFTHFVYNKVRIIFFASILHFFEKFQKNFDKLEKIALTYALIYREHYDLEVYVWLNRKDL